MSKVEIPGCIFRYEGEFDFQDLYKSITGFFWSRNYDVFEGKWKEKDATPIGREITINLDSDKKIDEYVRFKYKVRWKSMDFHDVGDGKQFARFWLRVEPFFIANWQGLGKRRWYERFYQDYLVAAELGEVYEAALADEAQELLDMIKAHVGAEIHG